MTLSGVLSSISNIATTVGSKVYSVVESIIGAIVSLCKMILDHIYSWMQGFWSLLRERPFDFVWLLGNIYILIAG